MSTPEQEPTAVSEDENTGEPKELAPGQVSAELARRLAELKAAVQKHLEGR